ncbi:MAG: MgtC/SapB family protein [Saprospiraceae bacterium]|nr:MgtC/SapB family protein [Saprospiraceae bacterium]
MTLNDFILRLATAFLIGFLVGLERQLAHKSAGLRTNLLVAVGSAIFVLLSLEMTAGGNGDATRIVGQVATGIGFLGAGVILHRGLNVQGLTTAATIWCSSALGCMAAAGYLAEALIAALVVLLINVGLKPVDAFFERREREKKEEDGNE